MMFECFCCPLYFIILTHVFLCLTIFLFHEIISFAYLLLQVIANSLAAVHCGYPPPLTLTLSGPHSHLSFSSLSLYWRSFEIFTVCSNEMGSSVAQLLSFPSFDFLVKKGEKGRPTIPFHLCLPLSPLLFSLSSFTLPPFLLFNVLSNLTLYPVFV